MPVFRRYDMNKTHLTFKDRLVLAPMAGVSDRCFRELCIEQGADYTVTEMISAKALCYADRKTALLAAITSAEMPVAIQIFGSDPGIMARAASMLASGTYEGCVSDCTPAAIDINMGCPVRKIVSNNEGSALLRDEGLVYEIVSAVKQSCGIPVTVKIRTGFDERHKNAVSVAKSVERAGADAICVHGRTREKMYSPGVDLDAIRSVKEAVGIPVIGNGDIYSSEDALRMKEYTGCDALMIARGALGNPFVFREIKSVLSGKEPIVAGIDERIVTAKRHLNMMVAYYGEERGVREARKHIAWYVKGVQGAPLIRDRINRTDSAKEIERLLDTVIKH